MQCLLALKARAGKTVNHKRFLSEYERTVNSRFEVRSSRFETLQCLLALKAGQAKLLTVSDFSASMSARLTVLPAGSMPNSNDRGMVCRKELILILVWKQVLV